MEAIIKADQRRGPGYGIIAISGADPIQDPSFVLQRAEDKRSLAANGCWQESASLLKPDAWQINGNILYLAVGPLLVNELDMLGAYRIQLTNDQACVLSVGQLVYSDMGGGQGIIGAGGEKIARPKEPEIQPEPPVKPAEPAARTQQQTEEPAKSNKAPDGAETGNIDKLTLEVDQKKASSGNWLAILLFLVIIGLLAGAGWWWLQKGENDGARPLPPIGQQGKKNPPLPDPRQAGAKTNTSAKTSNQTNALGQAREHLRGSADPATSLDLAKPLRTAEASAEQSDAAFLLLEDAAQKGQAEAMYLLGQFYDPVSTLPHGSIPLDMEQARLWYARAVEKGISQAGKALNDLHEHASREAKKGNALARRLLREWKQ